MAVSEDYPTSPLGMNGSSENDTEFDGNIGAIDIVQTSIYSIICLVGLTGNCLVIYVVLRFSKMKTVTNMYLINLALSDFIFLLGIPLLITTTVTRRWLFGDFVCRTYFITTSINSYTSVFILTVLSADRWLAVCYPVKSAKYRTIKYSRCILVVVWVFSFLVMLPVVIYSRTTAHHQRSDFRSCTIHWPDNQPVPADKAFTWYTLMLGFLLPTALISVFYIQVVQRLKRSTPGIGSVRRSRKVTKMVLIVITTYVLCWLPYWIYQLHLTFTQAAESPPMWKIYIFHACQILSYANSMMNPLLYAFLSENFRNGFAKACVCAGSSEANQALQADQSIYPGRSSYPMSKYISIYNTRNNDRSLDDPTLDSQMLPEVALLDSSDSGTTRPKKFVTIDENSAQEREFSSSPL